MSFGSALATAATVRNPLSQNTRLRKQLAMNVSLYMTVHLRCSAFNEGDFSQGQQIRPSAGHQPVREVIQSHRHNSRFRQFQDRIERNLTTNPHPICSQNLTMPAAKPWQVCDKVCTTPLGVSYLRATTCTGISLHKSRSCMAR